MTQIVFLGTGTPNPDPRRQGPAIAIIVDGHPVIVDCGVGVVRQAAAAGIKMKDLTHAFITHLHSDHILGYPDLVFTPAVTGRESALNVWGPSGTQTMSDAIVAAFGEDVEVRLTGGEPAIVEAYEVRVTEVVQQDVVHLEGLTASPFNVSHGAWKHALGYRFEAKDRSIVISGDTTYNENLIRHAQGCDVLIHEVCSAKGLALRAPEWQQYHSTYHTTGLELGRLAAQVQPKLLLLNHVLPFGQPEEQIIEEIRETWAGPVEIPDDLSIY